MYPSNNKCLRNETMGSHSKTVIGILVITLMVIIGLFLLGVVGYVVAKNGIQKYELLFDPKISPGIKNSESILETTTLGSCDESVPDGLKDELGPFDTKRGTMDIVYSLSSLPQEPIELPLCLTQDFFDDYWVVVEVTGGYELKCGTLYVYQGLDAKREERGKVKINSQLLPSVSSSCCNAKRYNLTFELMCTNPICLESNHVPDLSGSDFWVCPDKPLNKEVYIDIKTKWTGCCLEEQEFLVILTHKAKSQNPQLPRIYTSPV